VCFHADETAQAGGLAQALGCGFDAVVVSGHVTADGLAEALRPVAEGYSHVAAVSSMKSKDVLARLAGLMEAAMVTDAVAVLSPTTFQRPMVAGSVLATVETMAAPVVLTFRPAGFKGSSSPDKTTEVQAPTGKAKLVSETVRGGSRPDLAQAKVVVSGGRPLGDAETFERVIGGLADKLGGAVGATRAAVDSGIAPNELQVGQTGKIVAPDLYIAAGISGSTQHMAGIKDSKIIVAVNKDPDAPIFESADIGLVADLFEALPELQSKI
jgi:electron transfer flavoprotein alpha subunit